jgi:hypothetical protein
MSSRGHLYVRGLLTCVQQWATGTLAGALERAEEQGDLDQQSYADMRDAIALLRDAQTLMDALGGDLTPEELKLFVEMRRAEAGALGTEGQC